MNHEEIITNHDPGYRIYHVGDRYNNDDDDYDWIVNAVFRDRDEGGTWSQHLFLYRVEIIEGQHHTVLIDYWNTWIYKNLDWVQTGSNIRRSHV